MDTPQQLITFLNTSFTLPPMHLALKLDRPDLVTCMINHCLEHPSSSLALWIAEFNAIIDVVCQHINIPRVCDPRLKIICGLYYLASYHDLGLPPEFKLTDPSLTLSVWLGRSYRTILAGIGDQGHIAKFMVKAAVATRTWSRIEEQLAKGLGVESSEIRLKLGWNLQEVEFHSSKVLSQYFDLKTLLSRLRTATQLVLVGDQDITLQDIRIPSCSDYNLHYMVNGLLLECQNVITAHITHLSGPSLTCPYLLGVTDLTWQCIDTLIADRVPRLSYLTLKSSFQSSTQVFAEVKQLTIPECPSLPVVAQAFPNISRIFLTQPSSSYLTLSQEMTDILHRPVMVAPL